MVVHMHALAHYLIVCLKLRKALVAASDCIDAHESLSPTDTRTDTEAFYAGREGEILVSPWLAGPR
jgi:hypothetical protein